MAGDLQSIFHKLRADYLPLIKGLQTGLLLSTGVAGYMTARCPVMHWTSLVGLVGSLALAICGSTALNMWYDRDLDARMERSCSRPLASGRITPAEALHLGLVFTLTGVGWAALMNQLYALVVFAGWFFDVVVYTLWLKRRTCWSIVWGGISGGMPILAGRVFGLGRVDGIGLLLALAVLFWIPSHILTFNMRYFEQYRTVGVPTFPARYGFQTTRRIIALSSILTAGCIAAAAAWIEVAYGSLWLLAALSGGLVVLATLSLYRPSDRLNFGLFKYASVFMLLAMILLSVGAF